MAKISRLPLAQKLTGEEYVPIIQNGDTRRVRADDIGGSPGDKGDPGGTDFSIGLLSQAPSLTIPVGIDLVSVTGFSIVGDAGASRQYVFDLLVDAGVVAANPEAAFIDAAGRGFRLVPQPDQFAPSPAPAYLKTASEIAAGSSVSISRFLPALAISGVMDHTGSYDADDELLSALQSGARRIDLAGGRLNLADAVRRQVGAGCGVRGGTLRIRGAVGGLEVGDISATRPSDVRHPIIDDVTIIGDVDSIGLPLHSDTFGIRYANGRYAGCVKDLKAYNLGVVVSFPDVGADASSQLGQNSSRIILDAARFENCNYFVRGARQTNRKYGPGDLTICNPIGHANIRHIELLGVDGLELVDPVFFSVGFNDTSPLGLARKALKEEIVYINTGHFVNISGGKYFEAGYEAIFLDECNEYNINGVQISWPGQRRPSSGIKIDNGWWSFDAGGGKSYSENAGSIIGNRIVAPTRHGIEFLSSKRAAGVEPNAITANATVQANGVRSPGSGAFYYGAAPIPPNGRTVYASGDTRRVWVHDNPTREGSVENLSQFGSTVGNIAAGEPVVMTAATTRLFLDTASRFQLLGDASLTITQAMLAGGPDGCEFTLENFSTGTLTVEQGTYLQLRKGATVNIPRFRVMTLRKCVAADGSNTIFMEVSDTSTLNTAVTAPRFAFQAASDRTINSGAGTPEGVVEAAIGSTYHQRDGSASGVLWVKENGSGKTGWVPLQARRHGPSSQRPTGLSASAAGLAFYDETLGKPVWWSGSAWRDAAGASI